MKEICVAFDLKDFDVDNIEENETTITIHGHTTETSVTCELCGKQTTRRNGHGKERRVRHLDIMHKPVIMCYFPQRYICCEHPNFYVTATATPPFHDVKSHFTYEREASLLLDLVNSTIKDVALKNHTTEKMIQGIVDRNIAGQVDWSTFCTLGTLGIDEITLLKGRKNFVSIITSRVDGKIRILSVIKGRKKRDIKRFLKSIPVKLRKTVTAICVDMYTGYLNAAKDVFKGHAVIVDRYHVAKLYRKALDHFRSQVMSDLKKTLTAAEYDKIKHVTNLLRGHKEYFTKEEKKKLDALFSNSFELSEAYRLARELTHIFNTHLDSDEGISKFNNWVREVRLTKLTCFNKFIKTLHKFKTEIANYFIARDNSGFVEGFNNKIKVLKRRCYGIFDPKTLFKRLFIDTEGYGLYAINIGIL